VLRSIARHVPFELAIGQNGQVWVNAGAPSHIIGVSQSILTTEHLSVEKIDTVVDALMARVLK
jgi:exosome complex component RRP40